MEIIMRLLGSIFFDKTVVITNCVMIRFLFIFYYYLIVRRVFIVGAHRHSGAFGLFA